MGTPIASILDAAREQINAGKSPAEFEEALKDALRFDGAVTALALEQEFPTMKVLEGVAEPMKLSKINASVIGHTIRFDALIDAEEVGLALLKEATYSCTFCKATISVKGTESPESCPNCRRRSMKINDKSVMFDDYSRIYVKELPRNVEAANEEDYKSLQSKRWTVKYSGIPSDARSVCIVAFVMGIPEKASRKSLDGVANIEFFALKVVPLEDEAETIKVSPDEHRAFIQYFGDAANHKALCAYQLAPAIVGKDFHKEAKLLVLHSPLEAWDIRGQKKIRTALRVVEVGDTKTAKSDVMRDIGYDHYRIGELFVVETSSRSGLLYNIDPEVRVIHWGGLVLNDRGLVMLDGLQHIQSDEMGQMREALEQGRLKVARSVTGERPVRVRIIAGMNPASPKNMSDYYHRIEALMGTFAFQDAADLTRWDLVLSSATDDVPGKDITSVVPGDRPVPDEAFKRHVLWAWSLKPDDIEYSEEAKTKIVEFANKLYAYVNSRYPLIHNGVREQVSRIAIAYACFRHSVSDDFKKVIVKGVHVELANEFVLKMLEYLDFDDFIMGIRQSTELTDEERTKIVASFSSHHNSILQELVKATGKVNADVIGTAVGVSGQQIKQKYYPELKEHKLIETVPGAGARLTAKGIAYMKSITEVAEPLAHHIPKTMSQTVLEKDNGTILDYTTIRGKTYTPHLYIPQNAIYNIVRIVVDTSIVKIVYLDILDNNKPVENPNSKTNLERKEPVLKDPQKIHRWLMEREGRQAEIKEYEAHWGSGTWADEDFLDLEMRGGIWRPRDGVVKARPMDDAEVD